MGSDCPLALITIISECYNYDFNGTGILLINFSRALFKDWICYFFQIITNNSLEALSNGWIFSISLSSHDCPLALIDTCSGYYDEDFKGTEIILLKLSHGTLQRLLLLSFKVLLIQTRSTIQWLHPQHFTSLSKSNYKYRI